MVQFPLYFLEFPLYFPCALCLMKINTKSNRNLGTCYFYILELRGATRPNSSSCGEPAVARTQGLASLTYQGLSTLAS
jgi:hypothetical protein